MKTALIQLKQSNDVKENLSRVERLIKEAAGVDLIVLPEAFLAPFGTERLESYESVYKRIGELAKEVGATIVAGTIPENDGSFYNTAFVFDRHGSLLEKYRKIHLFDVSLKNLKTSESDRYSPGKKPVVFEVDGIMVGLAVCYDLRFPELFLELREMGAEVIVVPAAFSYETGKRDWELLNRARAVDSQCFLISCAPAQREDVPFPVYAHSMCVGPDGTVLANAGKDEEILYFEFDPRDVDSIREGLPLMRAREILK